MTLPAIVQRYLEAYNAMDVVALVACVGDSVVFEHVSNTGGSIRVEGRTAFAELAEQGATLFVWRRQVVRTALVDDDRVALEIVWTAMPAADFGQMKVGVETTLRGASFFKIREGKLAEIVDIS